MKNQTAEVGADTRQQEIIKNILYFDNNADI
jgi:hypothetical protein